MWRIVYNVLLFALLPFFLIFGVVKRKVRINLVERLLGTFRSTESARYFWIHAASIGEAVIAENLINYLKIQGESPAFLVTVNTYYTKELLQQRLSGVILHALPFDFLFSVRRFLAGHNFSVLVIVETEIWPNLIWEARKRGIPVVIINGRISDRTVKTYRRFSFFFRHVLDHIEMILAQSETHSRRFVAAGMAKSRVMSTGNIKYYRNIQPDSDTLHEQEIITFGSIKEKEIDQVLGALYVLKKRFPGLLIFIVPRELHLVSTIESRVSRHLPVTLYSAFREKKDVPAHVVVVDTVGDLMDCYRVSKAAFVGGSLAPYGGQNILEPLFFGTPVLFGPHVENFSDAAKVILEEKAGLVVENGEELAARMEELLVNETLRQEMGKKGRLIIDRQKEVMVKTCEVLSAIIAAGPQM
jgi:3-deoxy-D-manno-octulosonic-acid transferase